MRLLMQQLFATANGGNAASSPANDVLKRLSADFKSLALWNDPRHIYTHCLCETP
jgi:hypothetical protein